MSIPSRRPPLPRLQPLDAVGVAAAFFIGPSPPHSRSVAVVVRSLGLSSSLPLSPPPPPARRLAALLKKAVGGDFSAQSSSFVRSVGG